MLIVLAFAAPAAFVGAANGVVVDGNVDNAYSGRFIDLPYQAKENYTGRFAFVETDDAYYAIFIQDPRAKSNAYCADTKNAPGCSQKFDSLVGSDYIGFTWNVGGRAITVPVDTLSTSTSAPSGYSSVMGRDGGSATGISLSAVEGHSGLDYSLNALGWRDFNNSPNFAGQPSHPFIYANQAEVRLDKAAGQLANGLNLNNVSMDAHNSPNSAMPPNVPSPTPTPPQQTPTPTPTPTPTATPSTPPGSVEIDKIYCAVAGANGQRTTFEVLGPGQGAGSPGDDAAGCEFGDATFTISDSNGNVAFHGPVGADGIRQVPLAPGTYTIRESGAVESATFQIISGQLTAVVVTNYRAGLVKIIKYFCTRLHDPNVVFVVEGQGSIPSKAGCVPGNATFRIDNGPWFSLAEDGTDDGLTMRWVLPGTHTLSELFPHQATSGQFKVGYASPLDGLSDGEVTTIFVFDYSTSTPTPTPTPTQGPNGSISGRVCVASDSSTNCPANGSIAGVTVQLFNATTASLVASAVTDANGNYLFNVPAGAYYLREVQPGGFNQGGIFPGSIGGFAAQVDLILGINLPAGVNAVNYNYSELIGPPISPTPSPTPPVTPTPPITPSPSPTPSPTPTASATPGQNSLSGCVYVANDAVTLFPGNGPISGVLVQLLNANTLAVVGSAQTGPNGCYLFSNIPTGSYVVREFQPNGYDQGGIFPCSVGGVPAPVDLILGVNVSGGSNVTGCNYSEIPVGPTPSPTPPCNCETPTPSPSPTPSPTPSPSCDCPTPQPNGSLSGYVYSAPNASTVWPGNGPISGVTVELYKANTATLFAITTTDGSGYYVLPNVPAGMYFLREVQPNGYAQGGIFPGSAGGSAAAVDLILSISLGAGVNASNYNFSEIASGPTPSPTPTPIGQTCLTNRPDLTMIEINNSNLSSLLVNGNGTFTDGTASINVNNYNGHTFNWLSNIAITSIFARTANGGALFEYDPATLFANGIGTTNSITNLSFCYKLQGGPTPTPTPVHTPTPTPTLPDTTIAPAVNGTSSTTGALLAGILIVVLAVALALGSGRRRNRHVVRAHVSTVWSTSPPRS